MTFWCNAHERQATDTGPDGRPRCDPLLGGLMIPCRVVDLTGIILWRDRGLLESVRRAVFPPDQDPE